MFMLNKDLICLLVSALVFNSPSIASASVACGDDEPCIEIGGFPVDAEVEETSSRRRQLPQKSPSSVTILNREDIEASGATSIPDLLRLVPGMDVVKITPFYTSVSSRLHYSDESSNFLVLVDGQEVNLDFIGLVPWSLQAIALDDVERIEVVRGPMSVLYGGGALGGVVHIFTRMVPHDTSAWAQAEGGEVDSLWAGARASARVGRNLRLSVWGGGSRMGNYDEPLIEGMRSWKLRTAAEYRFLDDVYLRFDGSISEGSGRFYSKLGPFDGTLEQRMLRVLYRTPAFSGQLHWSQTPVTARLDSTMSFAGITLATFAPMTIDVHTLVGDVHYAMPELWKPLYLMVGGQARLQWLDCDHCLDADTYSDPNSDNHHQPGVDATEFRAGVFTHAELQPAELITASAGLRMDYDTAVGAVLSLRLASVIHPTGGQYLRLGVGRSWRR
jgi:outer membrane receptor for ferrienterochelin and colicin